MSSEDPCNLYVEVEGEEEEVSPEFQSMPFGDANIFDAIRVVQGQEEPEVTDLNPALTGFIQTMDAGMQSGNEVISQLLEQGRLQAEGQRQELLNENLNDETLTPVYQNYLAAARSTWLFKNSSTIRTGQRDGLFESKSKHFLALQVAPFTTNVRAPVNVYDTSYTVDSLRWFSDRLWINSSDLAGPIEYTLNSVKLEHGKTIESSDFYFINKTSGFGTAWGTLYADSNKVAFIATPDPAIASSELYSTQNWRNIDQIRQTMNSSNFLDLEIKHEVYEIRALVTGEQSSWSWTDYFAGNIQPRFAEEFVVGNGSREIVSNFRNSTQQQDSPTQWNLIYFAGLGPIPEIAGPNGASLNSSPVIPFYGERFENTENTSPLNPTGTGFMPTVGRKFYEDFTTNIPGILTKEESDVLDVGSKTYVDVRPVYSYYDCLYEKVFGDVLSEIELPSPYLRTPELSYNSSSRRSQGLNEPLKTDFVELLSTRLQVADQFLQTDFFSSGRIPYSNSVLQNFAQNQNEFADLIRGETNRAPEASRDLAKHMSDYYGFNIDNTNNNIYLSSRSPEKLDEIYDQRRMNPMYVELELGKVQKSHLAEAMTVDGDDVLMRNLFTSLMGDMVTANSDNLVNAEILLRTSITETTLGIASEDDLSGVSTVSQLLQSGLDEAEDQEVLGVRTLTTNTESVLPFNPIDFAKWFDGQFKFYTGQQATTLSALEKFANIMKMLLVKIRITRFINSRSRTYAQIMSGVPAKSEALGYTVAKYKVNPSNGEPEYISSFHILSNNDRDVERFVDSQVKYGGIYEYEIRQVVAVVGNRYAYSDIATDLDIFTDKDFKKGLGIVNMPFLTIVSVPLLTKRVAIADLPPVSPNVNFIPYKGVGNKVLINLSAATGEYLAKPVTLRDSDKPHFLSMCIAQGLVDPIVAINTDPTIPMEELLPDGAMLRHRNDDAVIGYEAYRIDFEPTSYESFRDQTIAQKRGHADSMSFVDNIIPNKKYYYIFRTLDVHGHLSNPSEIFMIEMVVIEGASRLKVATYDIPVGEMFDSNVTSGRQFLYILPNLAQRIFNPPSDGRFRTLENEEPSNILGDNAVDKVWNKRFKLRVRSNKTGKEIDINFRFNVKVHRQDENKKVNLIC